MPLDSAAFAKPLLSWHRPSETIAAIVPLIAAALLPGGNGDRPTVEGRLWEDEVCLRSIVVVHFE